MITSVLIDSREPSTYHLKDYGVPAVVTSLEAGDLWATTDDGHILVIERKTPDDLLASIKDERLFTQAGALAEMDREIYFPYLVIDGYLSADSTGKTVTGRGVTGWNYAAVQGALLTVQEMGIPIINCVDNYANCVRRLADRSREPVRIQPPRPIKHLGDGAAVLLALPGIGPEMLNRIMKETRGIGHAICMLSDPEIQSSVPAGTRSRIRDFFGLKDQFLVLAPNEKGEEVLQVVEEM